MTSFKTRLVAYVLVLSLLSLSAAYWAFSGVARRGEDRRLEARLQSGLRAGSAALEDELRSARTTAERLARDRSVQRALARGDGAALRRVARATPYEVTFGSEASLPNGLAARRSVAVLLGRRLLGRVTVSVPFDSALVGHLQARSGLEPGELLVLARRGRVAVGPRRFLGEPLPASPGHARVITLGGVRYRSLATRSLREPSGAHVVALVPQGRADAAAQATQERLLLGLTASLALTGLTAYLLSRSVVRRLAALARAANAIAAGRLSERVPAEGRDEFAALGRSFNDMAGQLEARLAELAAERRRLQEATSRFGDALAATLDVEQLRQVIIETAVEATGARGGRLEADGIAVTAGEPGGADRIELPLLAGAQSFGTLLLRGDGFAADAAETAASFAAQAVVALENERLHRIVERQALLDGLTGLANRRHLEDVLRGEVARATRFDAGLSLVLADLDRFKAVNDEFGHPAGDAVLREFAALVGETVREGDTAGRWGGEEFALLLPGTDLAGASNLAERLRESLSLRTTLVGDGTRIPVTASFGVATLLPGTEAEELVAAADAALYRAKAEGRNRVVTADHSLRVT